MRVKGLAILKATRRQRREWSCKIKNREGESQTHKREDYVRTRNGV